MLKIGALQLQSNLILAPMAGVSDLPFRLLNRKFGCELAFIEMLNCRSVSHKGRKTKQMLSTNNRDKPLGLQLLGCEEKYVLKSMDVLGNYKFDILDFNSACPVRKVTRRGEGAGLLREPKKLNKLLKLIVKHSCVPVTVKIRTGWDEDTVNAKEVALWVQDAGVNGLFIHGRTKSQEYSGSVDYKVIREVKKALDIPVIGSGDIFSAELAKKMFDETSCDGVAVARGSLGNPWIFKEISSYLKKGKAARKPTLNQRVNTALEHLNMCTAFYGERVGVVIFRKFFSWYTKGLRNVRPLRERASCANTSDDMISIIMACRP